MSTDPTSLDLADYASSCRLPSTTDVYRQDDGTWSIADICAPGRFGQMLTTTGTWTADEDPNDVFFPGLRTALAFALAHPREGAPRIVQPDDIDLDTYLGLLRTEAAPRSTVGRIERFGVTLGWLSTAVVDHVGYLLDADGRWVITGPKYDDERILYPTPASAVAATLDHPWTQADRIPATG